MKNKTMWSLIIFVVVIVAIIGSILTGLIKIPGFELTALSPPGTACISNSECNTGYCQNAGTGSYNTQRSVNTGCNGELGYVCPTTYNNYTVANCVIHFGSTHYCGSGPIPWGVVVNWTFLPQQTPVTGGCSATMTSGDSCYITINYITGKCAGMPPCPIGGYMCSGSVLQYCPDGSGWVNNSYCGYGCDSTKTPAQCFPYKHGCWCSGTSISVCSQDGYNIANQTACSSGCDQVSGKCNSDPCAGITCPDKCDTSGNRQYNGQCSNGICQYSTISCQGYGCSGAGVCNQAPNLCAGVTCSDKCDSSGNRQTAGYCVNGTCQYTTLTCSGYGCSAGICNSPPNLCAGVTCPDTCSVSGDREIGGYCLQGTCHYTVISCSGYGCTGAGICNQPPNPCAGITCQDKCVGNIRYYSGYCGTGTAGSCQYSTQDCKTLGCDSKSPVQCFKLIKNQQVCQDGVMVVSTDGYNYVAVQPSCTYGCIDGTTTCNSAPPIGVQWNDLKSYYNTNEQFPITVTFTGLTGDTVTGVTGKIITQDGTTEAASSVKTVSTSSSSQTYQFTFTSVVDTGKFFVYLQYTNPKTGQSETATSQAIWFRHPINVTVSYASQFPSTSPVRFQLILEPATPLSNFCENTNMTIIATSKSVNPQIYTLNPYASHGTTYQLGATTGEYACDITIDAGHLPLEYSPYDMAVYVQDQTGNYNPGKATLSNVQITSSSISLAFGYSPTEASQLKIGTPITITYTSNPNDLNSLTVTITNPDSSYSKTYTYGLGATGDTKISHTLGTNAYTFVWTPTLGQSHYFNTVATKSGYVDYTYYPIPNLPITGGLCSCDTGKGTCQANCNCDPDCLTCESQGGITILGFCLILGFGTILVYGIIGVIVISVIYYVWKSKLKKAK